MSARTAGPRSTITAGAFLLGLLLGTALISPVVPSIVAALPSRTSVGPIGTVLLLGVLGIVVFVFGLVAVYWGFLLFEE